MDSGPLFSGYSIAQREYDRRQAMLAQECECGHARGQHLMAEGTGACYSCHREADYASNCERFSQVGW